MVASVSLDATSSRSDFALSRIVVMSLSVVWRAFAHSFSRASSEPSLSCMSRRPRCPFWSSASRAPRSSSRLSSSALRASSASSIFPSSRRSLSSFRRSVSSSLVLVSIWICASFSFSTFALTALPMSVAGILSLADLSAMGIPGLRGEFATRAI